MDPVSIFPPHVIDMMFIHLSGEELLSNTLVSPSWNDFIGKSSKCMEKLTLKLRNLVQDNFETQRIYINFVSTVFEEWTGESMIKVMSLSNRWKSVEIRNLECESTKEIHDLLKIFEATVENLILSGVSIKKDFELTTEFNFKKLNTLKIVESNRRVNLQIFINSPLLTSLRIRGICCEEGSKIMEFMERNDQFQSLSMDRDFFEKIFSSNIDKVSFKLRDFEVWSFCSYPLQELITKNFLKFILTQMEYMEQIQIETWFTKDIINLIYRMKKLKSLRYANYPVSTLFNSILPINETIENLDIAVIHYSRIELIKIIITASPNLKHLRVGEVNQELALFFVENLKKLETINVVLKPRADVKKMLKTVVFH